jgi:hypothetical protein
MKNEFSALEVQKIDELNNKLIAIEEEIYLLAEIENNRAKKRVAESSNPHMYDYELMVNLMFLNTKEKDEHEDPKEIYSWDEPVYFESFEEGDPFGINDKQCHNVSSAFIKNRALNTQKHCWLLHRLYDDFFVSWKDILSINNIYFDINLSYQYERRV